MSNPTVGVGLFDGAFDKPVVGLFHESEASSNGGIALLAVAAKRTGNFDAMALLMRTTAIHRVCCIAWSEC